MSNANEQIERAASAIRDEAWQASRAIQTQAEIVGIELTRPSVIFRPSIAPDGDQWSALYGPNIMEGVVAYGDTPEKAAEAFDVAWRTQKTAAAIRLEAAR